MICKYVTNDGTVFVFKTNLNALRYKLIRIDLSEQNPKWTDLIPEKEDVIESVKCINQNKLVICYMHDCKVRLNTD